MQEEMKHSQGSRLRDTADDLLLYGDNGSMSPNPYNDIYDQYDFEEDLRIAGDGQSHIPEEDEDSHYDRTSDDHNTGSSHPSNNNPQMKGKSIETASTLESGPSRGSGITHSIRKAKYLPISDEGRVYKYEDDPKMYMRVRKKIQNRESARRVRIREKDGVSTIHNRMAELQEMNQRLMIENGSLKSENLMLKSQVCFMEKLLLKQSTETRKQGLNTSDSDDSQLFRDKGAKARNGLFGGPGVIALLGLVLIVTYLPEGTTTNSAPLQQRILAEIGTGFHIFSINSFSSAVLSVFRLLTTMALFYSLFMVLTEVYKKSRARSGELLFEELLKKNT